MEVSFSGGPPPPPFFRGFPYFTLVHFECYEISILPTNGFSSKPPKVKLLAAEQKATEFSAPPPPLGGGTKSVGQPQRREVGGLHARGALRCAEP